MPFLGGSCIMDAIEQSRNRICYLWKNLKLEKTRSEITGKRTFSKGEENLKNKNKWIFFLFIFFTNSVFHFFKTVSLYFKWKRIFKCNDNHSIPGRSKYFLQAGLVFDTTFVKWMDYYGILFLFQWKKQQLSPGKHANHSIKPTMPVKANEIW